MKLKVCGMKYSENIIEIAKQNPNYLGFIFWNKSSRFFTGTIPEIPNSIEKVGVFVDANLDEITTKMEQYDLDLIQLHGEETSDFCRELKSKNYRIIKAFAVDSGFNFEKLKEYELVCDYFLFDTKGVLPGGNGTAFDWNILSKYHLETPFFLSGGIGIQDCKKINEFMLSDTSKKCIALDVNSKFEIKPGLKNEKEILQFKKMLNEN